MNFSPIKSIYSTILRESEKTTRKRYVLAFQLKYQIFLPQLILKYYNYFTVISLKYTTKNMQMYILALKITVKP